MKRITLALSLVLFHFTSGTAQKRLQIRMNDGSITTMPLSEVQHISFGQPTPASLEGLPGQWRLIAMPNGSSVDGIFTAKADTIYFTATVAADGNSLECTATNFYSRSGQTYPAHWRVVVQQDGERRRLGWVLDTTSPASDKEFLETQDKYLEDGFFYWASSTEGHRYIYLLSENIETQRLEGMTLWSGWVSGKAASATYTFPQNQEIYGVVASQIPYGGSIGYFDIWASPRFEKLELAQ